MQGSAMSDRSLQRVSPLGMNYWGIQAAFSTKMYCIIFCYISYYTMLYYLISRYIVLDTAVPPTTSSQIRALVFEELLFGEQLYMNTQEKYLGA